MIVRMIFALLMAALMVGCGSQHVDYFPYHENGKPKPKVVLLPLADDTGGCVCWDLAKELNTDLSYQVLCNGQLFLVSENEVCSRLEGCSALDYFTPDLSFSQRFCGADYVVALEIVDHDIIPYQREMCKWSISPQKYHWRSVLQTKVRLRIIDVHCMTPRVVLQEVFTSHYPIPTEKECIDYSRCCWGTDAYPSTPWAKAHERLICELVYRIESVILCP